MDHRNVFSAEISNLCVVNFDTRRQISTVHDGRCWNIFSHISQRTKCLSITKINIR